MKANSVKIINYKSIVDENNTIIIEPNITPIIGKNESGKSNVIEALSCIDFYNRKSEMNNKDLLPRFVNVNESKMEFIVELLPYEDSIEINKSVIHIKYNEMIVKGGLYEYFESNILPIINDFIILLKNYPTNSNDYQVFIKYINILKNKKMDIPLICQALNFFKSKYLKENNTDIEKKNILIRICDLWEELISQIPVFYKRNDRKILASSYSVDEAKKAINNPNSLLKQLLKVIDVSIEEFVNAITSESFSNRSLQSKINKKVNKIINNQFVKFYNEEAVKLSLNFTSGKVFLEVTTNEGETVTLNERSNGLKWYLNLFIDIMANDLPQRNVVYLLDEPGISLHINAQKQILNLFNDLTSKGNQVIYTTHLPTMLSLENNGIHRIRAVDKTEEGVSRIFKTAYDSRITTNNVLDTLTPITKALGMSINDLFGISNSKVNIIVEGVSDLIYLSEFNKLFYEYADKFQFIASCGAENVFNIYAILNGWGSLAIILLDYDAEGVKVGEGKLNKKYDLKFNKDYLYVLDITQEDLTNKTFANNPYVIEDLVGKEILNDFKENNNINEKIDKALLAKLYTNSINKNFNNLNCITKENFRRLFQRMIEMKK